MTSERDNSGEYPKKIVAEDSESSHGDVKWARQEAGAANLSRHLQIAELQVMEDENIRKNEIQKIYIRRSRIFLCLQISAFLMAVGVLSIQIFNLGNYKLDPIEMGVAMVFLGSIVVGAPVAAAKWMIQEIRNK